MGLGWPMTLALGEVLYVEDRLSWLDLEFAGKLRENHNI
jgi:hypothetical protein